ncbi:ATP-binding protein [Streptomyces sp. B-S-A8]|uniref:histidine kinase n=1 Tax=Streptomyces solicavernae TaxID=3043614 RepID=A0ABT6RM08_9ACTN|nr:ATP-binding protein [Streptomyces sp. B-S-A8]MDI3385471.1 ATP-binding protein [Streptomyces sp. B-S-A8]
MIQYLGQQDWVFWCLIGAMVVLAVLALRGHNVARVQRKRSAEAMAQRQRRDDAARYLLESYLPRLANPNETPPPFQLPEAYGSLAGSDFEHDLRVIAEWFSQLSDVARDRMGESLWKLLKVIGESFLARGSEQQKTISDLERLLQDPRMLEALMKVDHRTSYFLRKARNIVVLCGGFPGRSRRPETVTDVVRGATGYIRGFTRVRLVSELDVGVAAHAVNPVVHAIAELLDNADQFSNPEQPIEVELERLPNGVAISVDDRGLGMAPKKVQEANELLSRPPALDIEELAEEPSFGFRVVGLLAQQYGFSVGLKTSLYKGVRAVVMLPNALLTQMPESAPKQVSGVAPQRPMDAINGQRALDAAAVNGRATVFPSAAATEDRPAVAPPPPAPRPAPAPRPEPTPMPAPRQEPTPTHAPIQSTEPAPTPPPAPEPPRAPAPEPPRAHTAPTARSWPATPEPETSAESGRREGTPPPGQEELGTTSGGLPRRRRKAPTADARLQDADVQPRSAEETARRMAALQRGNREGRVSSTADEFKGKTTS